MTGDFTRDWTRMRILVYSFLGRYGIVFARRAGIDWSFASIVFAR